MPVNDVKIKVRNGYDQSCELEVEPNHMGTGFGTDPSNVLMLTVVRKKDDADRSMDDTIQMAVNLDELKNAIDICERAWYNDVEVVGCIECGKL
jgi:hypothetical protein